MRNIRWLLVASLVCGILVSESRACPFCSAVSQTFAEEMNSMDVVVLANFLEGIKEEPQPGSTAAIPKSVFEVTHLVKGKAWAKAGQRIEAEYFGKPDKKAIYLIMGTDPPHLMWTRPLAMSEDGQNYLIQVASLPKDPSRLKFFLNYLEHRDEMLARDAYDEFAKAPYEDVISLRPHIDRQQMVDWITDTDVPVSRRRLYLTMLGVAGTEKDADMLETFMRSNDRKKKAGLDAMIACYLTLKGNAGLPLVEKLFLGNKEAEYSDTYAAIMAYRFHGTEGDVIPRNQLLVGLRMVLERPDLADLVIPDLARWEDWSVMPRLVQLFQDADEDSNWVRVPVVNYLRACPLDEAQGYMEELTKIDPDAVKRASTFFPFAKPSGKQRSGNVADDSKSDEDQGDDTTEKADVVERPPAATGS